MPSRATIARRPPDMRCRALVGSSTKRDGTVTQCQNPIVFVLPNGRMVKEDPGNGGYWAIFDAAHRQQKLADRVDDVRDDNGDRAYGPQRIIKGQTSDPWADPVEGGTRWAADG